MTPLFLEKGVNHQPHADRMLTTAEACEIAGLSKWQLRQEITARRLKAKRVGHKTILIRRAWLDEWMGRETKF